MAQAARHNALILNSSVEWLARRERLSLMNLLGGLGDLLDEAKISRARCCAARAARVVPIAG